MRRTLYLRRLLYTVKNCEHSEPNGLSAAYTFVTLLQLRFSGCTNSFGLGLVFVYYNLILPGILLYFDNYYFFKYQSTLIRAGNKEWLEPMSIQIAVFMRQYLSRPISEEFPVPPSLFLLL